MVSGNNFAKHRLRNILSCCLQVRPVLPMNEETTPISVPIHSVAWPWSPSEESWSPTLGQASLQRPAREIPALCISCPLLSVSKENSTASVNTVCSATLLWMHTWVVSTFFSDDHSPVNILEHILLWTYAVISVG